MSADNNVAPKRGIPRLRELIEQRQQRGEGDSMWTDSRTVRHEFRGFNAKLATEDTRSPLQRKADSYEDAREMVLSNSALIDVMSIRILARDRKRKGKIVEAWVRARFLARVIERVSPSRDGLSHSRYTIAMMLLCNEGVAMPHPDGRDGYMWTPAHKSILTRTQWLVDYTRRVGEFRKTSAAQRYQVLD